MNQSKAKTDTTTADELWLSYFNRRLREEGVITDSEYARMNEKIAGFHSKSPVRLVSGG